jgi:hypothetical protein
MEDWQTIPQFPDYEASTLGYIRNKKTQKLIKHSINGSYCQIILYKDKRRYTQKVHRLIATTFIQNPEEKPTVNHKNKDTRDNRSENLEWMTVKEQNNHKVQVEFHKKESYTRPIWKCDKVTRERIKLYDSVKDACIDVNPNNTYSIEKKIYTVVNGHRKSCFGYYWEYQEYEIIEGEIWKEIDSNLIGKIGYNVSSEGRVRNEKGKLFHGHSDASGYVRVSINERLHRVHVLVTRTFLPNFYGKPHVNHKDGNRSNNRLYNLEWSTRSENMKHAYDTGLNPGRSRV